MANSLTKIKTNAIDDDAVTLAKQAAGTDGQIITYDASGNPTAVGPGTDGQVLTSTGAGSPPAFEALPASGAALTGSTDNTITTVTGANAIQGEANLVFDGTNLGVNIASPTVGYGGDKGIHIHSSTTTGTRGSSIHLTSGTSGTTAADGSRINTSDNDLVIQNMEDGRLDLGTNGAHRLTIKGDGKIGIGTDAPETTLSVDGGVAISSNNVAISPSGFDLKIRSNTCKLGIHTDNASDLPTLEFGIGNTNGGKITTSGNGALQICPNDTEEARFLSGGGLTFNGDTAAANALDDYEEGAWTPTLPNGGTLNIYNASYTKVGRLVTWWAYIYPSSIPDNTTAFIIGGFPFTSNSTSNMGGSAVNGYSGSFDMSNFGYYKNTGDTNLALYFIGGSSVGGQVQNGHLTGATRYLALSGQYYTS